MTKLVSKLEQVVNTAIKRAPIIPVKTNKGILVGNVLIESQDNLKNLWKLDELVYSEVNLNAAAIKLANDLVRYGKTPRSRELYSFDQEYGRWLIDSQLHYRNHSRALADLQYDRADILWARYCESRDRCAESKQRVERMSVL